MADQSIALQAKAPRIDVTEPLAAVQKLLMGEEMLQQSRRQGQAQGIEMNDALMRRALARAHDAQSWDEAMGEAAAAGATDAERYRGQYSPLLALRLGEQYGTAPQNQARNAANQSGGAAPPQGGGDDPAFMEQWANASEQERAATIKNLTKAQQLISNVRGPEDWDRAVDQMVEAGAPEAAQFKGRYGIEGDAMARQMLSNIQKHLDYANQASGTMGGMGGSARHPLATREVGGTLVNENLATGEFSYPDIKGERPQTAQDDWQYAGVDGEGRPIMINRRTGAEKIGQNKISAKPTARTASFNDRFALAKQIFPNDDEKAYAAAMGRMPLGRDQIVRGADQQASKDLSDLNLSGQGPDDPDAWLRERSKYYQDRWSEGAAGPRTAPPATNSDSTIGNAVRRGVEGNLKPVPQTGAPPRKAPNASQLQFLRAHPTPENKAFFDKKFGAGEADRILGGGGQGGNEDGSAPDGPDARRAGIDTSGEFARYSAGPMKGRLVMDQNTNTPVRSEDVALDETGFDAQGFNDGASATPPMTPAQAREARSQWWDGAYGRNPDGSTYNPTRTLSGATVGNAYGQGAKMSAINRADARGNQPPPRPRESLGARDAERDFTQSLNPGFNSSSGSGDVFTAEPTGTEDRAERAANRLATLVENDPLARGRRERLRADQRAFNRDASNVEARGDRDIRDAYGRERQFYDDFRNVVDSIPEAPGAAAVIAQHIAREPAVQDFLAFLKSLDPNTGRRRRTTGNPR